MRNSIRPSSQRTRLLSAGTTIVAALALVGLSVSPAAAAGHGPTITTNSGDYSFESWYCGYPMQVVGHFTSKVRERQRPYDGDPLRIETFAFSETWTNSAEASFGLSGNGVSKEWKVKSLGGTLYEVTAQRSGQPQIVTANGAVIARDSGLVSFSFTHDAATGAEEFLGAKVNGPHPGFDTDLCKIVAPYVGNTSAEHQIARPLGSTGAGMGYYEYLPPSYDAGGSPLLVVANGYGENGDGSAEALSNLLFTGIPRFIDVGGWPLDRPFVVLSTQHVQQEPFIDGTACDAEQWPGSCNLILQHTLGHPAGSGCTTPDELHDFIGYAVAHYNVDPTRVYVTGLSCGAFGVWEYLAKYGDEQVAAAVPYAGEGRPAWATSGCALDAVPVWALAGELDDVVNPLGSIEPINALSACPGVTTDRAKLTIYEGLYHEGWDEAYSGAFGDDIYSWMLSFSN
ncbi:carboxylesterase family protein [Microbacterium sp. P5_E9]